MRTLTTSLMLLLSVIATAQNRPTDKTLDINYIASYKDSFSLKWSSKLSEKQDWALKSFTAGGAYNLNKATNRFSVVYDFWRGCEPNAGISTRYGMAYNTQSKFTNLSFSIFQTDSFTAPSGIAGRIDINMKFK
jgi:hypothetical protein